MARNINTQVYDNVVNRSAEMRLYSTGQRRAVAGVVEDHGKKMVKIVANGDKLGKADRDALLVGQIKATYSGLHAKSEKDLKF
jgi:phosphosulfolactate phosphohydrolase-like enzyme